MIRWHNQSTPVVLIVDPETLNVSSNLLFKTSVLIKHTMNWKGRGASDLSGNVLFKN